ncbi:MAG: hypothetical protein SAL07_00360 [Oscillatoria sp. PMC 1051.18]|nr:hypothetical protein [Oscillatoria sp. PMC 1050.18]MEC5028338.1 hypothetical protein [Oscillatoria sp. PMC 1051.18]
MANNPLLTSDAIEENSKSKMISRAAENLETALGLSPTLQTFVKLEQAQHPAVYPGMRELAIAIQIELGLLFLLLFFILIRVKNK